MLIVWYNEAAKVFKLESSVALKVGWKENSSGKVMMNLLVRAFKVTVLTVVPSLKIVNQNSYSSGSPKALEVSE